MFLQVRWPNQQCQSTEGGWSVIQIALNLTRLIPPCYNNTTCMHVQDNDTHKSKHSEWTQWDEAKSGRLNLWAAPMIVQLQSSSSNIPSHSWPNQSSDMAKWSSRGRCARDLFKPRPRRGWNGTSWVRDRDLGRDVRWKPSSTEMWISVTNCVLGDHVSLFLSFSRYIFGNWNNTGLHIGLHLRSCRRRLLGLS